jgi:two-component system, chemotaxis family, sensor histidine kinase and response regulator WspE
MSALWPLLVSELQRLEPLLADMQIADAELFKLRQRQNGELCAAISMAGNTPSIEKAQKWLRAVHQDLTLFQANATATSNWLSAIFALAAQADATAALQAFVTQAERLPATPQAASPTAFDSAAANPTAANSTLDPAQMRLRALFAGEVEDKTASMVRWLLKLEQNPEQIDLIAPLMRAAHSLKGAARAVGLESLIKVAHAFEDRMSHAQKANEAIAPSLIQLALDTVDAMKRLALVTAAAPDTALQSQAQQVLYRLETYQAESVASDLSTSARSSRAYIDVEEADPVLRVRASVIGKLISLAGAQMLQAQHLNRFAERQLAARRELLEISNSFDRLSQLQSDAIRELQNVSATANTDAGRSEDVRTETGRLRIATHQHAELSLQLRRKLLDAKQHALQFSESFGEQLRRTTHLSERLYHLASTTRLRPMDDLVSGYHRLIRDLARETGKQAQLLIVGGNVPVDRDVLDQLDAPLSHLLNNAVDHGLETPAIRRDAGKAELGTVQIRASIRAAMLVIEISDDGAGIDLERVRASAVRNQRYSETDAAELGAQALYDYLLQAGVSTREVVSEISGRGVGLDVVNQAIREMGGQFKISSTLGAGTQFRLTVPISRAVTRALVLRVGGDAYALPLARIAKVVMTPVDRLVLAEGLQYWQDGVERVSLSALAEHLDLGVTRIEQEQVPLIVLEHLGQQLALIVERIDGEFDLNMQPLDPRLGRIADVAALSVLPDGRPVVMLDADDLVRSATSDRQQALHIHRQQSQASKAETRKLRILVADDSISVRELERQLLSLHGYEVDVAADGYVAWAKLRESSFDLLITDVDMPRMDGIELTRSVKQDARLKQLPVVIVSYRDRDEDRQRGLDARADAYITKSDFQDDRFLGIVHDLIGPAEATSR